MADGIPPTAASGIPEPPQQPPGREPPPLDAIRMKGPPAKGLNKRAILLAAGGGVALVLVLASGALTPNPARRPTDTKPIMSDPARPEMAQGAIRFLPSDYTQAAALAPEPIPVTPPRLGPPLPGDIAAFADPDPMLRGRGDSSAGDWTSEIPEDEASAPTTEDDEEKSAERSALFFALRSPPPRNVPANDVVSAPEDRPLSGAAAPPGLAERSLFPGAFISASLVTELNSEAPGPVIAQVTQAIYDSSTGRNLLIPQGARLIGDYKSSTRYGQSRVAIAWHRLIMPDGTERALNEAAASPSGAAGVAGEVDDHWGDVFGAAALGTLINIGVATTEDPQITFSGVGGISRDPVEQAIQEGVQDSAASLTNRIVDRGLAVPPTVRVQSGTRVSVIVTRRSTF